MSAKEIPASEVFLYSRLTDFIDGDMRPNEMPTIAALIAKVADQNLMHQFQGARGKLQLSLQSYHVPGEHMLDLHNLIEDPKSRQTQEAIHIAAVDRKEKFNTWKRRFILIAILLVATLGLVYPLLPSSPHRHNPLDYIAYEAMALEDDADGRWGIQSADDLEISRYLRQYLSLGFTATILPTPNGWRSEGANILDYDSFKIAEVVFKKSSSDERLFLFSTAGLLSELPKTEQGQWQDLTYRPYKTDRFNIIAWQSASGTVAFLLGREGTLDLAKYARAEGQ